MKRGTIEHPKTLMLADALKIRHLEAVGVLESLWHWAAKYAPRGDIGRYSNAMIASGIHWHGNADRLVECLLSSQGDSKYGWVEQHPVCRIIIHDWSDHADESVHKALAKKGVTFADGRKPFSRNSRPDRDDIATEEGTGRDLGETQSRPPSLAKPSLAKASLSGGGDEAHRILISAVNLRGVTWEQDLTARKERSDVKDWIPVCKAAAEQSVLATVLNHPGFWVRKFYIGWGREQGSFKHGVPDGGDFAKKNKFRGYSDEPEVKPKGWVSAAGKLNAAGRGPAKPDPGMDGSEVNS